MGKPKDEMSYTTLSITSGPTQAIIGVQNAPPTSVGISFIPHLKKSPHALNAGGVLGFCCSSDATNDQHSQVKVLDLGY